MNTQRVQELLGQIANGEAKIAELEQAVAEAGKRLEAQRGLTLELKRELAHELRDVLPGGGGAKGFAPSRCGGKGVPPSMGRTSGRAGGGVSEAVLEALADGQPHAAGDLRTALAARGIPAASLAMALNYQIKRGRIRREGRGVYVKA